jgi:putative transposase
VYPYLLRGVSIERPNQVWSTDIKYVPMTSGFFYLVAIMDWFSRFVLRWELSNTMETGFWLAALEAAFRFGQREIWNSDQGLQFTSADFLAPLKKLAYRSAWMGGDSHWTMSSSNACGTASSTSSSIPTTSPAGGS